MISTFDENALEVALQVKEANGGQVTVLTVGGPSAIEALHHGMAMGADSAILISDPVLNYTTPSTWTEQVEPDPFARAAILASAVRKVGDADLVLCGRQAGDVELGLVGPFLAEEMKWPCVTLVASVKVQGKQAQVKRVVTDGYEVVGVATPFVGTVTSDSSNVPRLASALKIIAAARRPVLNWKLTDLSLDPNAFGPKTWRVIIQNATVPQKVERCDIIEGETDDEKAEKLAARLRPQQIGSEDGL